MRASRRWSAIPDYQPSIAFIMFGTNDVGYRSQDEYTHDMTEIISQSMQMGVIPYDHHSTPAARE
jgi:lysophospholipase L1-like esterase